jgi:hypothetical protein
MRRPIKRRILELLVFGVAFSGRRGAKKGPRAAGATAWSQRDDQQRLTWSPPRFGKFPKLPRYGETSIAKLGE